MQRAIRQTWADSLGPGMKYVATQLPAHSVGMLVAGNASKHGFEAMTGTDTSYHDRLAMEDVQEGL